MREALPRLYRTLGYQFADVHLLESALTHRSAAAQNNERLEFLGDSILGFVVAIALYRHKQYASEGELTRLRASLVRRETLAQLARDLGLGPFLKLGPGELKSGGRNRDSILADAFEALVGAVYLDSDIDTCMSLVLNIFDARLNEVVAVAAEKDPKTKLQEYLQARHLDLPEYTVAEIGGSPHEHSFTVECRISDHHEVTRGIGSTRRGAEQDAARQALTMLQAATEPNAH